MLGLFLGREWKGDVLVVQLHLFVAVWKTTENLSRSENYFHSLSSQTTMQMTEKIAHRENF